MTPNTDPLAELRDIHLPDPVSLWPPAPALLATLAGIALLSVIAIAWYRSSGRLRRAALAELRSAYARYSRDGNLSRLIAACSALMKRVAVVCGPRADVAGLHGAAWAEYLQRTGFDQSAVPDLGAQLDHALYGDTPLSNVEVEEKNWMDAVKRWIRRNT